jgi:large subunit ribosomal protein L17
MRHAKHRFSLGVKKEHRVAMMAHLVSALAKHGRIETTLAKAKALRPFADTMVTLAKKAAIAQDPAVKLHYRRLALARMRDHEAVCELFDKKASEFANRPGGYTRIYKLGLRRQGDAAEMALIEFVKAEDKPYGRRSARKGAAKKATVATPAAAASTEATAEASA